MSEAEQGMMQLQSAPQLSHHELCVQMFVIMTLLKNVFFYLTIFTNLFLLMSFKSTERVSEVDQREVRRRDVGEKLNAA